MVAMTHLHVSMPQDEKLRADSPNPSSDNEPIPCGLKTTGSAPCGRTRGAVFELEIRRCYDATDNTAPKDDWCCYWSLAEWSEGSVAGRSVS
jgi:hypothetical protein